MQEGFLQNIIDSKSKTFLAFCFSFLLGIVSFSFVPEKLSWYPFIISFCAATALLILFFSSRYFRFIFLCIIFFILAAIRFNASLPQKIENNIYFYSGQKLMLRGFVSGDPDIREDAVHYKISLQDISYQNIQKEVSGNVFVKGPLYPRYRYGEILDIKCLLETPKASENFHYEKYLATKDIFTLCQNPSFETTHNFIPNSFFKILFSFKEKVAEKINGLWHEPYASFVAGILYGYRGGLGTLQEDFNRTGLTHIVAVSGFNISIIATYLGLFFLSFGISRKKAFWLIAFFIASFVLFTGASGSAVRAGVMGILVLFAKQIGRPSRVFNILIFSIFLMALQNPFVLIWDIGFQLSYLSTIGLIYFSKILDRRCHFLPEKFALREMLVTTLSAIIFTLPLLLYQFGRFSLVALVANLLVLPVVSPLMALGFVSLLSSFLFFPLAKFFAFAAYLVMRYVTFVVGYFGGLSFASIDMPIPFWLMMLLYIFLFSLLTQKKKNASS